MVLCADCGVDTSCGNGIGEWYMVKDKIWRRAKAKGGILCIGCLEKRLSRTLCRDDFTDAPVNDPGFYRYCSIHVSNRLRDRWKRTGRRVAKEEGNE